MESKETVQENARTAYRHLDLLAAWPSASRTARAGHLASTTLKWGGVHFIYLAFSLRFGTANPTLVVDAAILSLKLHIVHKISPSSEGNHQTTMGHLHG